MRIRDHSDRTWEKIARSDPYYGVLTADRFRSGQLNDDSKAEFFRSGEEHTIERIMVRLHHQLER